ncbi:Phosphotransferase enzyme family protein [Shimia marina]|uniref:Thiamine kinase n=1 Tax=Shimia marina TaxID=321267 RepID=A0A0P1F7C1_9RHOB|nr:thiamine kinase [Shimia marina]SFD50677.1 Phosphotransferase enzyme family protein [Shimia marina]
MAWLGSAPGLESIVVKLYKGPARNPLFPNDPDAEARLLRFLAPNDIAPKLLGCFETGAGRCNVYAHIPGNIWSENTESVAKLMRKLHGLPPPQGLRLIPDGAAALRAQIETIQSQYGQNLPFPDALSEIAVPANAPMVLLHGDIVPGNLIENETGLYLIDWQCPAVGDPCEDIAVFLSPAMQSLYRGKVLSQTEADAFFDGYDAPEITTRYKRLAPLYHARMATYCQWQIEHDQPAYAEGLQLELEALQRSLSA